VKIALEAAVVALLVVTTALGTGLALRALPPGMPADVRRLAHRCGAALGAGLGSVLVLGVLVQGAGLGAPRTVILGLLQTTGWTLLQTFAVALGGAGKSAVLGYTMPFWTALLAWPFLGERITWLRWIALGLAAAGLAFVVAPLDARSFVADGLAVLAGLSWGASAVWAKRLRKQHDVDLLSLTTWQLLWGTIPLVVLMLAIGGPVHWTKSFVAAMAFMSIGGAALGWFLWMFILSRLPAGVAGIASLATPVVGVLAAAIQLHEIPSRSELVGMALIVVALVVNSVPTRSEPALAGAVPIEGP